MTSSSERQVPWLRAWPSFILFTALAPGQVRADTAPSPVSEPNPPSACAQGLCGNWRFVGGSSERTGLERAIEAATEEMNFISRPIAQRRLKDSLQVPESLQIWETDREIAIMMQGRGAASAPRSGASVPYRNAKGERLQLSHRLAAAALAQSFRGDEGSRHNWFRLTGNGNKMVLTTTIRSEKLPQPIVFRLTFERID